MKKGWSKWQHFDEKGAHAIPREGGVYQFRCLRDKSLPLSIWRLRKKDSQGIIYIGKSQDLRKRIFDFWSTLKNRKKTRHAAGWTYCSFNYFSIFPPRRLQFRYKLAKNPLAEEFELLISYRKQFLDLPPLNSTRSEYPGNWKKRMREVFGVDPLKE
jgi:hypothetical protein